MMTVCRCMIFFFFKQKTAYEMRISDWSSDVCSSDLYERLVFPSIERGECIADRLLPFRAGIGGNPVLRQRADRRHDVVIRHQHAARNRGMPSKCVEAP